MAAGYLQASTIDQICNRSRSLKINIETFFFLFYIVNLNTSHVFLENITKFRTKKSQTTKKPCDFLNYSKITNFYHRTGEKFAKMVAKTWK